MIPIIRKQYATDLLTTYGSKQLAWPAIASRLKGVGESAGKDQLSPHDTELSFRSRYVHCFSCSHSTCY